jgi:sensor histidine kinase regulating citrate/malate metabolism
VGLRLVHDIVTGLGGTLHHDRAEGRTVIRVDLPAQGQANA